MKKLSLIILISCITLTAFAQKKPAKHKAISAKPDTTETFILTKTEATFLYKMLEDYKKFVATSDEITARQANKLYQPNIDSLERILGKQAAIYENRAKAKTDSLAKLKAKADSVKNKSASAKPNH